MLKVDQSRRVFIAKCIGGESDNTVISSDGLSWSKFHAEVMACTTDGEVWEFCVGTQTYGYYFENVEGWKHITTRRGQKRVWDVDHFRIVA